MHKFKIGDSVIFNGFNQSLIAVAVFKNLKGEVCIAVENKDEFLHIFKENEIELK